MTDGQAASRRSWHDSVRSRMPSKLHIWLLSLILAIGFVRGMYWVATMEVWSRVDEAQHYGYVESLAQGHGMPKVGKDKLQLDARGVAKASPTIGFRSFGLYTVSEDSDWGVYGNLYEGGGYQGPLYYALLVPVYWVAHPLGIIPTIYALRLATLLILLTSIPLLWLLARELFPKRPAIWLTSPAILVAIQGFNSNTTSITNDALLVPISIAALIPVASAWRGINNRQAIIAGALFGLAMLCKNTAAPLAVLTLIVLVGMLLTRRASLRDLFVWGLIYAGTAFVVLLPYHVWNLYTYGALSASSEVHDLLAPLLQHTPFTPAGLRTHFHNVRIGFWDFSYGLGANSAYARTFEIAMIVSVIAGLAVALRRRAFDDASPLVWAAIGFPVAFVIVLAASVSIYGAGSTIVGRHLYAILGLFAIAIAAGASISLGPRLGVLAVVLLLGIAFVHERGVTDHYVLATYADGVLYDKFAPVVDQPLNEGYTTANSVSAAATCPVQAVGLAIVNPVPNEVALTSPSAMIANYIGENKSVSYYALPVPQSGQFTILTPGLQVGRKFADHDPTISLDGATGDPVVRLYCAVDNPDAFRFKQMFDPGHLDLSYSLVRAWADIWYWIGWALVAVSAAGMAAMAYAQLRPGRR